MPGTTRLTVARPAALALTCTALIASTGAQAPAWLRSSSELDCRSQVGNLQLAIRGGPMPGGITLLWASRSGRGIPLPFGVLHLDPLSLGSLATLPLDGKGEAVFRATFRSRGGLAFPVQGVSFDSKARLRTSEPVRVDFACCPQPPRTLVRRFEDLDQGFRNGDGYRNENNDQALLAWVESYGMMAYVAMYEATGNVKFLRKLVHHADGVLANRDDRRRVTDYRNVSGAAWRTLKYQDNGVPYCWVVHSGMITYPMAWFAQLVRADSGLRNVLAWDGKTFAEKADTYIARTAETIAFHDWQWRNGPGAGEGHYLIPSNAPSPLQRGRNLPLNQQNAMGRTLVAMARATGNTGYRDKASRLATFFKRRIGSKGNTSIWTYWASLAPGHRGQGEDLSHASINADFAAVAHRAGIVFTAADLARIAAAYTTNVIAGEGEVFDRIDGSGGKNYYRDASGRWLGLQPWEPLKNTYRSTQAIYHDLLKWSSTSGQRLLAVANLARFESVVTLRSILTGFGPASAWAGITGADLDGDGRDEIAQIRNFDGNLYAYRYGTGRGSFTNYASLSFSNPSLRWAGLTAADLDGDGDDELIAVRNSDGQFVFLESTGAGKLRVTGATSGWGRASNWVGVAAGVFEKNKPEWIATARNFDGVVSILHYRKDASGSTIATYRGFDANSRIGAIAAGDFDGDGVDEVAVATNIDGSLWILERQGAALKVVASTKVFGSASAWAGLAAADMDGDGKDELLAVRNFDGGGYRLTRHGAQIRGSRMQWFGSSLAWGGLGRLEVARGCRRNLLLGISNRTAATMVYGVER